jgi:two-component system, cell cycle sensor histidine kinase and response regulator CckA
LWEADASGRCLYASPAAERMLGHPVTAWLEEAFWRSQIHPSDSEWVARIRSEAASRGEPYTCDFRMHRADKSLLWVRERGRPAAGGARVRGVTTEIGDHKRLEAELLHSRKLETLGRLIGGVAHDFTNLAMALTGYSDVVLMQLDAAHPARPFAEQLKAASQSAVSLLRQLLAFSRKREIEPTLVNVNDNVKGMVKLLRKIIGDPIKVETGLDAHLALVRIDPGQIDQILMNLAVNARDAMPGGGQLAIETANTDTAPSGRTGAWVVLRVRDSGVGMTAETRERIFEPFFTTKKPDEGTGLGLALVWEIVDRSGGTIRVDSAPGQGTLFEIFLPAIEGQALLAPPRDAPIPGGTETLLFVDDDETVRQLFAQGLTRLGYHVLQAPSGSAALAEVERHAGTIDLVVTDLVMADMSGLDLVRVLRESRPDLRSLYITGYAEAPAMIPDSGSLLEKPFRLDQLAQEIREMLHRPE